MNEQDFNKGFIAGMGSVIIGMIIGLFFIVLFSCQPKDKYRGLNCPCKVISAEITPRGHKVVYIDKDGKERKPVISKVLYDQYKKKKPLNK